MDCPTSGQMVLHRPMKTMMENSKMKIYLQPFDVLSVPTGTESHRFRTLDDSRFGMGVTDAGDEDNDDIGTEDSDLDQRSLQLPLVMSGTSVKSINFTQFRAILIDSFNIAFHKNELKWPRRFPKGSMPVAITSYND